MSRWEKLENGKWRLKDEYRAMDPNSQEYARKIKSSMMKTWIYCEECKTKYCLGNPCIHHLSDSPEDRKKYEDHKKARKAKMQVAETSKQERLK